MKRYLIFIALIIFTTFSKKCLSQVLNTVAKTGFVPYSKNWHASELIFENEANDVAYDSAGNLYYTIKSRIVKIDRLSGIHTIIAGQSLSGYYGDGGLAKDALLNNPFGIALDRNNNIIFGDKYNCRIRKINQATGIIQTIAGTGEYNISGDGGLAINAKIAAPGGIAIDTSGNILFTDYFKNIIRKINTKTGIITTYAGGGLGGLSTSPIPAHLASFSNPTDIAINKNNDVFIADMENNRIRKVSSTNNLVYVFAGSDSLNFQDGILAIDARLYAPNAICFDDSDNLYILDYNNTLKRVNVLDDKIYTLAGIRDSIGFAGDGLNLNNVLLFHPQGLDYNKLSKSIIINDHYNFRLRELSLYSHSPKRQSDHHLCLNEPENPLTAIGTNLKWYDQPIGGVPLPSAPIPKTNVTDTINYFVSQTIDGKESPRSSIVVGIHAADTLYKVDKQIEFCYNTPTLFLYQNVYLSSWLSRIKYFYDSELLDSVDISTDEVKLRTGTKKYFAQAISPFGCKSNVDSFDVIVRPKLQIPKFQSPTNICQWDPVFYPKAQGTNLLWYIDTLGGAYETPPKLATGAVNTVYYYVTQTDSSYCTSDFGIMQVNVNPKPKEFVSVKSPVEYCQYMESDTLMANGPNLSWFSEDTVFLGKEAPRPSTKNAGKTKTLVCVQNEFGCKGFFSSVTTIINPKPSVTSNMDLTRPYTGVPIMLNCSSDHGKTFIWNTKDTSSRIIYTPKNEGRYYFGVQSTSEFGCKSDTSWTFADIMPSEYWNSNFEVHPNPFKNHLSLTNVNLKDIMSLNLYNLNGIKVFQSDLPLKSLEINVPEYLPSGYYIVEINTVGRAHPSKLVYKN